MAKKTDAAPRFRPTSPSWRMLLRSLPTVLFYQLLSIVLLLLGSQVFGWLINLVLHASGRRALSWSDWRFILLHPLGWVIILLGFMLLLWYVLFDLQVKIVYSRELLEGRRARVRPVLTQVLRSARHLVNWHGAAIVVFIALLAPLVGSNRLSIVLTESIQIPPFISSVITSTWWFWVFLAVKTVLVFVGWLYVFCLHGVLIDNLDLRESCARSYHYIAKHWRDYIWAQIRLALVSASIIIVGIMGIVVTAVVVGVLAGVSETALELYDTMLLQLIISLSTSIAANWSILYLTHLYLSYRDEQARAFAIPASRSIWWTWAMLLIIMALMIPVAWFLNEHVDDFFDAIDDTIIVAHRGGGHEGIENSLQGLRHSIEHHVYGAEFDIQRTSDGHYVVNHDTTFKRMTGMDKKSTQMTLAEIRQLCLVDTQADPDKCEPVATLEEYLDTARGQIKLFIELKGETADAQMVDDVVALVRARGMEHQVALTSLERDVIAYADRVYPEMETVYVSFVGFGELGSLPGDILGLEETAMTGNALLSIHNSGKRAIVWTPNTRESLTKYMREEVDILYTDEPTLAAQIQDELDRESPREKILDFLLGD